MDFNDPLFEGKKVCTENVVGLSNARLLGKELIHCANNYNYFFFLFRKLNINSYLV